MLLIVILDFVYSFKPSTFGIPENVQRLNVSQMSMVGEWNDEINHDDPEEVQYWPQYSYSTTCRLTTPILDFDEFWIIGVKYYTHGYFTVRFKGVIDEFDEAGSERETVIVYHYKSSEIIHSDIVIETNLMGGVINCLYFSTPAPTETETESMTESITEIITNTYDKTVIESKTETATEMITKSESETEIVSNTEIISEIMSESETTIEKESETEIIINTQETESMTEMIINNQEFRESEIISESVINTQEFQERSTNKHTNIIMICTLVPLSVIILVCLLVVYLYKKHKTVTNEEINENTDYSVGL